MKENQIIIKIKNLVKRYPKTEKPALNGIDFDVFQGEFFGLLGPNGSGKTTLISILCGLLHPSSGDAEIYGHSIKNKSQKIRQIIGLVPQDIALYPTLTLRQNLHFFAKLYHIPRKVINERIDKYLEVAQLTDNADQLVKGFSGGMKRRANLIAGMLHEPKIIFLDEPTVGVDTISRYVLFATLKNFNKEGKTLIYTTHYLEEAQKLCSRIGIIKEGNIVTHGSPQELVTRTEGAKDLADVFIKVAGIDLRKEE